MTWLMTPKHINFSVVDRVATLELNRPQARNGFTNQMADELSAALDHLAADEAVRVVILTGAGKDFCVGADLSGGSLETTGAPIDDAWVEPASRVTRRLFALDKPVIAAIRGAAVGVGSTMILPADFRLASADSRFGFVFSRRGIYPEGGSTWFLPRLVGLGRALEWMIAGRLISAEVALSAGLLTSVCTNDVVAEANALAQELITHTAPVSVAVIRQALYRMSGLESPEAAFALDSRLIASCASNPDAVEGIVSFLERRPPAFTQAVPANLPSFLPWRKLHHETNTRPPMETSRP